MLPSCPGLPLYCTRCISSGPGSATGSPGTALPHVVMGDARREQERTAATLQPDCAGLALDSAPVCAHRPRSLNHRDFRLHCRSPRPASVKRGAGLINPAPSFVLSLCSLLYSCALLSIVDYTSLRCSIYAIYPALLYSTLLPSWVSSTSSPARPVSSLAMTSSVSSSTPRSRSLPCPRW